MVAKGFKINLALKYVNYYRNNPYRFVGCRTRSFIHLRWMDPCSSRTRYHHDRYENDERQEQ